MNVRLLSWNINGLSELWSQVAAEPVDVALVQEARRPPAHLSLDVVPGVDEEWRTDGWEKRPWRTALARVSDAVSIDPLPTGGPFVEDWATLRVSRLGTLTAARVVVDGVPRFVAVSVYCPWERPLGCDDPIWADASAHRILSDLVPVLHNARHLPVVIAGDWNILFGYGEHGSDHWARRYATVFERAEAIDLMFKGPQVETGGRQAEPWPDELPRGSKNVPTYHTRQQGIDGATRQLDFVFASRSIADRVTARARNEVADWGSSDHCRIMIDVAL